MSFFNEFRLYARNVYHLGFAIPFPWFDLFFTSSIVIFLVWAALQIRMGFLDRTVNLAIIFGCFAISINTLVNGLGILDVTFKFYFVILIVAAIFSDRRQLMLLTIFMLSSIVLVFLLERAGLMIPDLDRQGLRSLFLHIGAIALASVFLRLTVIRINEKNIELEQKTSELQRYQNQLEELVNSRTEELLAEKNRAEYANHVKSQFLANMSHELRTPLNAIIGYSDMLQEELVLLDEGDDLAEDSARIGKAGRHLLGLINDVLDFSKIEANEMDIQYSRFDLLGLINDINGVVQPLVEISNVKYVLDLPQEPLIIHSDAKRIRQVLLNLLSNAAKFAQHGTITLFVDLDLSAEGHPEVILKVSDTGIGISEEFLPHLFEPFRQVDNSLTRQHTGTGLGLSITKQICELLGGSIEVESAADVGSTFTVRIPPRPQPQINSAYPLFIPEQ
ncbi:MAG: ATP-binding protein [Chloroflexota bacterium]